MFVVGQGRERKQERLNVSSSWLTRPSGFCSTKKMCINDYYHIDDDGGNDSRNKIMIIIMDDSINCSTNSRQRLICHWK